MERGKHCLRMDLTKGTPRKELTKGTLFKGRVEREKHCLTEEWRERETLFKGRVDRGKHCLREEWREGNTVYGEIGRRRILCWGEWSLPISVPSFHYPHRSVFARM